MLLSLKNLSHLQTFILSIDASDGPTPQRRERLQRQIDRNERKQKRMEDDRKKKEQEELLLSQKQVHIDIILLLMDVMWEIQSYLTIRIFMSKVELLDYKGKVLPFQPVFQRKYSLKNISFHHYYQVISDIPGHLLTKATSKNLTFESISYEDPVSFRLTENVNINLLKAKSKDLYWLIIHRKYNDQHEGPTRWNKTITEDKLGKDI